MVFLDTGRVCINHDPFHPLGVQLQAHWPMLLSKWKASYAIATHVPKVEAYLPSNITSTRYREDQEGRKVNCAEGSPVAGRHGSAHRHV